MIKGSCACGRVRYETKTQPLAVTACHCITCQRVSGGPFLGFAGFLASAVEWTQKPDIWLASDIAERGFCKSCGSPVSMRYFLEADRIGVTLGTVVEAEPVLPSVEAHIFLKDKAQYYVLAADGAKRYDEFSGEFRDKLEQWGRRRQKG
ncbi:uncharacterized protein A1O5_10650 [Cladophialophora psammophila CBS 110553]|uniref:CENP-V/GFA domain-containing protein n=1 Tax=Cladophialophora psammophila CBS 110553 TaxID=1182543 RepID=W9WN24_9EURO|nr:uncharacterized protein A1O5_10650 [Cladophialophora psammophila CBS 110553]EXJ66036.1 hypothetical protein A1O5_10650 [Cladophialophora psammophila CBS 110553]